MSMQDGRSSVLHKRRETGSGRSFPRSVRRKATHDLEGEGRRSDRLKCRCLRANERGEGEMGGKEPAPDTREREDQEVGGGCG